MRCSLGTRLGLAAATALLLASGAACSADPETEPSPSATPSVTSSAPTPIPPSPSETSSESPRAKPSPTVPPPATTPVPPPTPGGVDTTVESKPEVSKKPVKIDKPSTTGTGLTVELGRIRAIEAKAQIPGEVAGPALAVTVDVTNTGDKAADLSTVVVTLFDSDEAPGGEMTADPAKPLKGSLAAGKSTSGVYVFTVPKKKRSPITVTVSIRDAPVLVFKGDAA